MKRMQTRLDSWRLVLPAILLGAKEIPASPTVKAHALAYYTLGQTPANSLSTPAMNTEPDGSTLLLAVGRGNIAAFTRVPTDNLGNAPCIQLGPTHGYIPQYPDSGTALYAYPSATGGAGQIITASTVADDEITLVAVEVKDGGVIQDCHWNEVLQGNPLTSESVTTTGPATLVAFWWGDGNETFTHLAVPNNGFTVIESLLPTGLLVQTAVATKDVTAAGSYNVTWDSGGLEGAQLYLVAVQDTPPVLQAQITGGSMAITWPISGSYRLETSTNLSATNAWMAVTNEPASLGSLNVLTNPVPSGNRFFRLRKT